MKSRYIPAFITLTAGALTCILSIVNRFEVLFSLKILLLVLVAFYILGIIARSIIVGSIEKVNQKKADTTSEGKIDNDMIENEKTASEEINNTEKSETTASTQ